MQANVPWPFAACRDGLMAALTSNGPIKAFITENKIAPIWKNNDGYERVIWKLN